MRLDEQLREALLHKSWSITRLAREAGIERSFISRLIQGGDPPRTRVGRHLAEHDERYRKLAVALDLDAEVFIDNVRRVQLGEEEVDLTERYPELEKVIRRHLPVRTRDDARRLLRSALEYLMPKQAAALCDEIEEAIQSAEQQAVTSRRVRSPDYLGIGGLEVPLDRRHFCDRIGDALVRLDVAETARLSVAEIARLRVRLAALFYELAPSVEAPRK